MKTLFLVTCFEVCMSEVSDKTDKFILNYGNLFSGPLFIHSQCISNVTPCTTAMWDYFYFFSQIFQGYCRLGLVHKRQLLQVVGASHCTGHGSFPSLSLQHASKVAVKMTDLLQLQSY